MDIDLKIKPLSVNCAWVGRRFKTPEYNRYERQVLLLLPKLQIKRPEKIGVKFVFLFSNKNQDIDGPIKLCIDILQKKYGRNDNRIYHLEIEKHIVKKSQEGIQISFYEVI